MQCSRAPKPLAVGPCGVMRSSLHLALVFFGFGLNVGDGVAITNRHCINPTAPSLLSAALAAETLHSLASDIVPPDRRNSSDSRL